MIKRLLKKLFARLFRKLEKEIDRDVKVEAEAVIDEGKIINDEVVADGFHVEAESVIDNMPPGGYVGWKSDDPKHKYNNWEPPSTGKLGVIETFLWKPASDTSGKPVVVVSCDLVPRDELNIAIVGTSYSISHKSRGNKLHKYGRINFYLNEPLQHFQRASGLRITFFQIKDGSHIIVPIKIAGKSYKEISVTDIGRRLDLK
jgi:hypothetical protein